MNTPYYIIDMNINGFTVPASISTRQPTQAQVNKFRKELEDFKAIKDAPEENRPVAPQTVTVPNAMVCHDIMKTAIQMAVPEGNPDTLRKLQRFNSAIEEALTKKNGQLMLSQDDYRWLQSKFAKADKWNTNQDVCDTVIEVQNTISRAAYVTTK
jgi:hypothetical protein